MSTEMNGSSLTKRPLATLVLEVIPMETEEQMWPGLLRNWSYENVFQLYVMVLFLLSNAYICI